MLYKATFYSPLGALALTADDNALLELRFGEKAPAENPNAILFQANSWLEKYFSGLPVEAGSLPLSPQGTPFQQRVWQILLKIPYGQTKTYGEIAKELSPRMSAQAAGNAVGKNPLPIMIPCHRVVSAAGIGGFSSGLEIKKKLLEIENAVPDKGWY